VNITLNELAIMEAQIHELNLRPSIHHAVMLAIQERKSEIRESIETIITKPIKP